MELALGTDDERLTLTVDDDGPGLADADRERVFERFERADGAGDGSGLGLALVRQQAELHDGSAGWSPHRWAACERSSHSARRRPPGLLEWPHQRKGVVRS